MKIYITCVLEDPNSDRADRLLPYLAIAKAPWGSVETRGTDPKHALANAKGIMLHALGDSSDPPDEIIFSYFDLSQKPPHAAP